jgi:hypothetical protein
MQEVEEAAIRSMLHSDDEKAAFEGVLYVRAKAMTADCRCLLLFGDKAWVVFSLRAAYNLCL